MSEYFQNIWLGIYTVLVGMKITIDHLFVKKVTLQYPDKYHPMPERYRKDKDRTQGIMPPNARNRLFVDMDECNGCNSCARDCPVDCITVETVKSVPGDVVPPLTSGGKRTLWVTNYQIDFAKCCFCSLCTQACPTNAIKHTTEFEYSTYDRKSLLVTFSKMKPELVLEKKEMLTKFNEEKKKADAAKKAAAAAAAPKAE